MSENKPQSASRRKRSPSYPYVSLSQAVELLHLLYNKEGLNQVPVPIALEDMKYSPTSGSAARVLSALLQFGLLNDQGSGDDRKVMVSDYGIAIMEAPTQSERLRALQEVALLPDAHRTLWDHFDLDSNPLPSDGTLRYTLLRDFEFHTNAVDSFVDEFKETYYYAQLDKPEVGKISEPDETPEESASPSAALVKQMQNSMRMESLGLAQSGMREHTIQLIGQEMALLILPYPISEQNYQHILNWLGVMKPALTYQEGQEQDDMNDVDINDDSEDDLPF